MVASPRASASGSHGDTRASPGFHKVELRESKPNAGSQMRTTDHPSSVVTRLRAPGSGSHEAKRDWSGSQVSIVSTNVCPPLSVDTGSREPGSGKKHKQGDTTGFMSVSTTDHKCVGTRVYEPRNPSKSGGGTTPAQPGEKRPVANCNASALATASKQSRATHEQHAADDRLLGSLPEDRLVSSSRRRRIATKRPPSDAECSALHAFKRQKRDTG